MQVSVGLSRTVHYKPDEAISRHSIKHLARNNIRKAVQDLLSDSATLQVVTSMLGKQIAEKEIAQISSPATLSGLRNYNDIAAITNFHWSQLWLDIVETTPALTTLLMSIIPAHKKDALIPALCVIVAMLAKARNRRLDIVEELLSLILHTGHASMQVGTYLSSIFCINSTLHDPHPHLHPQ